MAYIITADVTVRCKLAVGAHDKADAKRRAAVNLRKLIADSSDFTADVALLDDKKAQVCILKTEEYDLLKEMKQHRAVRTDPDSIEFFND